MKKILRCSSKVLFAVFLIVATLFLLFQASPAAALERDGRWIKYNGNYPYLIGYDLQQLFSDASYSETQIKAKIDILAAHGTTAFRVWVNTWFLTPGSTLYPYQYSNGKWNLDSFNSNYFSRYKNLITYAGSKGIIVEVVVFSEYPSTVGSNNYWNSADFANKIYWRSSNNTQGAWDDVGGDLWPEFFTWNYLSGGRNLTDYQKALASKVIDELTPLGNVFFQVHNEFPVVWGGGNPVNQVYSWQQNMADYFHNTKGAVTSVHAHEGSGMNTRGLGYWQSRASVDILNFHPYSDTGNGNIKAIGSMFGSLSFYGKILMFDESHAFEDSAYTNTVTREMWAAFTNGIYYLAYQDDPFIIGDSGWVSRAGRIQTLKNISELGDWRNAVRNPSLITAGPGAYWEGLANSGNFYVYYFTGTPKSTAVSINLPSGSYEYKFYDTRTWNSNGISRGSVNGGGIVSIASPGTSSWNGETGLVLAIKKSSATPTPTPTASPACDLFSSLTTVPAGFGAAYNVLSPAKELLMKVFCGQVATTFQIGDGNKYQYIYNKGYLWKTDRWELFDFQCSGANVSAWCVGESWFNTPITPAELAETNYIVAYICNWTGSTWKCGCRNSTCAPQSGQTYGYWNLQAFKK